MGRRVRRAAVGTAVLSIGLVALAVGVSAADQRPATHPAAADSGPVLVVEEAGGFVPPGVDFGRLPTVFVAADGRLITEGPVALVYPGPALPNVRQRLLAPAAMGRLDQLAREAGLDRPLDYGQPPVADAATTTVTWVDGTGATRVHRAYAPGLAEEGLTQDQRAARRRLATFIDRLADPTATFGPGQVGEDTPFVADAFRLRATPAADHGGDDGTPPPPGPRPSVQPWPLPGILLAEAGDCAPVSGPDAVVLREAMAPGRADQLTRWQQDGISYEVVARPLLPGERSCR